jgi:hypothetical protein
VEELVSRVDKKVVITTLVLFAGVVQAGLAGVAFYGRHAAEQELANELVKAESVVREIAARQQGGERQSGAPATQWQLLDGPDVPGTLQIVQTLGDAAGITLDSLKAAPSSTVGKQTFQIVARGTPRQVVTFLAGIEQHARLIVVESGKVVPASVDEIGFELGLATYHVGGGQ